VVAQEDALRKKVESLRQSLRGLSTGELEFARLTREAESSRSLQSLLSDKLNGARIREQGEMKVVKVIDPPAFPQPAINSKRLTFLGAACALALAFGAAVPAGVEWLHRKVESEDDVELATGLPVLATIPRVRRGPPRFASRVEDTGGKRPSEDFVFTEAFRTLRVNIQLAEARPFRSLLVTSAFASEGKSTTVLNLGMSFAEIGRRVVIVDSDFQRPALHRALNFMPQAGLVDALNGKQPINDTLAPVTEGMWLVPRGERLQPKSRGVLAGPRMTELLQEVGEVTDLIICDSSPVLLIPDNLFLTNKVDAVILVVKAGSTACRDLARTKTLLEAAGAKILGVVINEMPSRSLQNYYYRYYTYVKREVRA
jgi:capsular exopolysaccharide synthesis family protein